MHITITESLRKACATLLFLMTFCQPNMASDVWTLPLDPSSWSRTPGALRLETIENARAEGVSASRVLHDGDLDWSLTIGERIPVQPGDVFIIRYHGKNDGKSAVRPSVVLYDKNQQALSWVYGGQEELPFGEWKESETQFVVPRGAVALEPRVVGSGETDLTLELFQLERAKPLALANLSGSYEASNEFLRVAFNLEDASWSVEDRRTKRTWTPVESNSSLFVLDAVNLPQGIEYTLFDAENATTFRATILLEPDKPEISVRVSADADTAVRSDIHYPVPFAPRADDRIVLPVNEGISFPAVELPPSASYFHTFGGHGLCMAFWGVVHDSVDATESDGYMGIVETPDDSAIRLNLGKAYGESDIQTYSIAQAWLASKGVFRYDRFLRFVFFDQGGHVALCKRYRQYAEKIGLLITFDEKIKRNPGLEKGIDLLIGAANVWSWNGDKLTTLEKLRKMGFDRILWSSSGSPEEISRMNELDGVLTSKYDIYQDVMDPARYPELSYVHGDWVPEAWPQDLAWDSPEGRWTRGWEVDAADPKLPRIPCGVLCDAKAVPYAEERLSKLLATTPYRCQFIDTTVASPWRECWNPDHPTTRSESKAARMELLGLLGKRFNLVCGSETGIDASVPFCDYYEGMMSLGPWRCPESGRYLTRIWDEVPEVVEKYQLGETYRLPLFELVYHGCVVSYWYWGDHNDKFPSLWRKRDLFNALYGVPPMYAFLSDFLDENRERFIESYKIAQPVSRMTGRVEMTNHEFLTEDRRVQKTTFANGVAVGVNFGAEEYHSADGSFVIPAMSSVILHE